MERKGHWWAGSESESERRKVRDAVRQRERE